MKKDLAEIQKEVDDWAQQFDKPYFSPLSMMAAMTEEVGEVARVMNNLYGDKKKKDTEGALHLEEELGDLLFSLVCMANANSIDLDKAFDKKLDKINSRDINRWKHKEDK